MSGQVAFVYSSRFDRYDYGEDHPFKVARYRLAHELIEELDLLSGQEVVTVEATPLDEALLGVFHRPDYLARLREFSASETPRADFSFGLGDVENPVFPGMYDWARLACGGTLKAARLVASGACRSSFHMGGGWHHAHAARASGFSYLNDAVVAIHQLLQQGLRVAYVDIDAHHGDGVQEAFYDSSRVLTVSIHETGDDFFPHTGYARETGCGEGVGYSVNIPLFRHADDRLFRRAFDEIVVPVVTAFRPDILVTQMGVDSLRADPLARLEMTTASLEYAVQAFASLDLPWVALGGGGYDKVNVARGWALVWAGMRGIALPDLLPERFSARLRASGLRSERLRDLPHAAGEDDYRRALKLFDANVDWLRTNLLSRHKVVSGGRGESGRGERQPLLDPDGFPLFSLTEINRLPTEVKEGIYATLIPDAAFAAGGIDRKTLCGADGRRRVSFICPDGLGLLRIDLRRDPGDPDSLFFVEIADTPYRQIELSFCLINDPDAPRFAIDRDPSGRDNFFGTCRRNLAEEERAMAAGLFPHQVRRGLRMFSAFFSRFEAFVMRLGIDLIVAEPLSYDNAVRYEGYGFDYQSGKQLMLAIDREFGPGGALAARLDRSTPFRPPGAERTVHGRSWAIHDGLLGQPWDGVKIYKKCGTHAGIDTFPLRDRG